MKYGDKNHKKCKLIWTYSTRYGLDGDSFNKLMNS